MPSATNVGWDKRSARHGLLARALFLSQLSVVWGVVSGAWSITAGLLAGSLGVLGLGLIVLADVAGSSGLVWRFRVERRNPNGADRAEARVSLLVAGSLVVAAFFLAIEAIRALAAGSAAERSLSATVSAAAAAVVLGPLGLAKRRVAAALGSRALNGDATLSCVGAALGVLALLGLLAERLFGWWWLDRGAALLAAAIAAAEAARVFRNRPRTSL